MLPLASCSPLWLWRSRGSTDSTQQPCVAGLNPETIPGISFASFSSSKPSLFFLQTSLFLSLLSHTKGLPLSRGCHDNKTSPRLLRVGNAPTYNAI